jgi:hypothetical protein
MPIDNLTEAQALSDRLEATIPFQVRPGKDLLKTMRYSGATVTAETVFTVDQVKYSGDAIGISCGLESLAGQAAPKDKFVVPVTQLKFASDHAMAAEIEAYQQTRLRNQKIQDQAGFASEVLAKPPAAKQKVTKGFAKR